ncbi:hypothetical protein RCH18_002450 [Flavobacterium sp. PL11]|uniref:DUF2157 domain-containing protein n=1 Tax=Flavobacterium sp. PL11 TaxID=3071717 RepID=UPI002E046671|nr:hypothetical protein [Flavobacterium sp. PL11]
MENMHQRATQTLFDKQLITEEQYKQISSYRSLNIFSLNAELKIFLYLSVLLFTSGIGVLIYQNIDTIGHSIIISLIVIVTAICYYFSFKKAPPFQKNQMHFESSVMEYIVLTANLLTCILIGYLQIQYNTFGTNYGLATIIPTAIGLFSGYYFDNKNVLSLALMGLAAYIGLTVTPQSFLKNGLYDTNSLSYAATGLGIVLILWNCYSFKIKLKIHFALIFLTFALHLIGISCLNNIIDNNYYLLFSFILGIATYYFYNYSYQIKAVSLFIFTVLYGFIGLNITLFKIIDYLNLTDMFEIILILSPFYLIGAIFLFILLIKKFNSEIKK